MKEDSNTSNPSSSLMCCYPIPGLWFALTAEDFTSQFPPFTNPSKSSILRESTNWFRLSDRYGFVKPNDCRALDLMNAAAVEVMKELPDLCVAYGVSDEYRYFCFILSILD